MISLSRVCLLRNVAEVFAAGCTALFGAVSFSGMGRQRDFGEKLKKWSRD